MRIDLSKIAVFVAMTVLVLWVMFEVGKALLPSRADLRAERAATTERRMAECKANGGVVLDSRNGYVCVLDRVAVEIEPIFSSR